jgi:hypothetical protein
MLTVQLKGGGRPDVCSFGDEIRLALLLAVGLRLQKVGPYPGAHRRRIVA